MGGSWKVGTFRGIGIYIHWTFWIIVLYYLLSSMAESGLVAGMVAAGFVLAVFACVLAHEFGHAFAAAKFGIPTTDITLLPIGGVARLTRLPQEPWHELIIAVAGPAVNVVIALALILAGAVGAGELASKPSEISFIGQLCFINIGLVIFNMLPAFPMDGGRVLRSLLAIYLGHLRATEIAARVGRWMSLVFVIASIAYGQFGLLLIAVFVFIAGTAELFEARRRATASPPWMQWVWTPGQSGFQTNAQAAAWTFHTSYGPGSSEGPKGFPDKSDDVIDAIEVKEIPPGTYRIG